MQTFGFGPGHPAGLDQAAAAAQYMAAGVGVGPAGYDAMYKGMFHAVLACFIFNQRKTCSNAFS